MAVSEDQMAEEARIEEFKIENIIKGSFKNRKGEEQPKWDIVGPKDDDGYDKIFSTFSATLAEEIEAIYKDGGVVRLKLEKNRGGYWQIKNVAKEGEEFKERQSQSRYQKNYDLEARAAAVQAAARVSGNLGECIFFAEILTEFIKNGSVEFPEEIPDYVDPTAVKMAKTKKPEAVTP